MKFILSLFLFIHAFSVVSAKTITGKVLSIHDGDTITFLPSDSPKKAKLRLMGVDTPEVDFNGNSQGESAELARDYLKSLLPLNANISIELSDKNMDSNNRYLGQIIYNGIDLNLEMLKAGWGAIYFIYPYDKKLFVKYSEASSLADNNKLGIFSDKFSHNPLPYIFRQESKGIPGTNLVGDFKTKKLFSGEDVESVPHYHRVFFSNENTAIVQGFSF